MIIFDFLAEKAILSAVDKCASDVVRGLDMAKESNRTEELLQDIIIVQLGLAGVPGHNIRQIAGVSMDRVTRILKALKKARE
jgi:hypothetical protein